jgi:4-hydroxy-3-methylbut-2-enyl diphosphate reductase
MKGIFGENSLKIIRSNVLGFCMGVRRAVNYAVNEAKKSKGAPVYSFGPLVHNPRVLADLKKHGVETLDKLPPKLEGSSLVIRAHGVSPTVEKDLSGTGADIIDATCPIVKASQLKAEELSREGYCLFLAGEADHAEIKGILGYAQSYGSPYCVVADNAHDAGKAAKKLYGINSDAKTALIGQTTISEEEYLAIGEAVHLFFPNLEIIQTICASGIERQQALRELLDQTDAVVIVGGKDSANTRRLLAVAKKNGKPCVLVENVSEIPHEFYNYDKVGISSGTSTPDFLIDEVERALLG